MWRDGTSHLLFEPIECMETLAALIPRHAVNLVLYHGVLAPSARWRRQAVSYGRPAPDPNAQALEASPRAAVPTRALTWAALLRRVFALDVLACPHCGGRLRVLATVRDPLAGQALLAYLVRSGAPAAAPDHSGPRAIAMATLAFALVAVGTIECPDWRRPGRPHPSLPGRGRRAV